jgi:hypothetical protein
VNDDRDRDLWALEELEDWKQSTLGSLAEQGRLVVELQRSFLYSCEAIL